MQEVLTDQWDDEVAGWIVGATSQEIQRLFGISEPVYDGVFRWSGTYDGALLQSANSRKLSSLFGSYKFMRSLRPPYAPGGHTRLGESTRSFRHLDN